MRKINYMHSIKKGFLPLLLVMILVGFLVLKEPDLGAYFMMLAISMGILFLGGINIWIFFSILIGGFVLIATMIMAASWRAARFFAYLDPWEISNAQGKAYQLSHSLIAFGRGEAFGVGLGDAIEKQHYLPEAHTDFILAIIGEELGLSAWSLFCASSSGLFAVRLKSEDRRFIWSTFSQDLWLKALRFGSVFKPSLTLASQAVCFRRRV